MPTIRLTFEPWREITVGDTEYLALLRLGLVYTDASPPPPPPNFTNGQYDELDSPGSEVVNRILTGLSTGRLSESSLDASYARITRIPVVVYDDFAGLPDGPVAGRAPIVGPVWRTTGAVPPTITSGAMTSTGTGYAYTKPTVAPEAAWADVSFVIGTSADDKPMTIACALTDDAGMLNNLAAHLNWGPRSFALQVRQDAENPFPYLLTGNWVTDLEAGQVCRVGLSIRGKTATVLGPNGEIRTATDPRIAALNGGTWFWEPRAVSGSSARVRSVLATGRTSQGRGAGFADAVDLGGAGAVLDDQARAVGSRETITEVSIGINPANRMPGIFFGAQTIRTTLESAAAIGAASLSTKHPIPPGASLRIDSGTSVETITSGALSTGTARPYSTPLATVTTKAHAAGSVVVATPTATSRALMYLNASNGHFHLPDVPVLVAPGDKLYLGDQLDTYIERTGAAVARSSAPFQVQTGATLRSGSGAPIASGTAGDYYFRTDTPSTANQRIYVCTGGTAWLALI